MAVMRVDQMDELVGRFGEKGQAFLRQVMGRLMEATTRDMDERCEFEDGLFALILPGTDEANALAVADRLCVPGSPMQSADGQRPVEPHREHRRSSLQLYRRGSWTSC